MSEFTPYEEIFKRPPDFRIKYKIYAHEEGGRWAPVYQGARFNFLYNHPDHGKGEQFMIWPEFEDEKGEVIIAQVPVESQGTARMWIALTDRSSYHSGKLQIGTTGFLMEGTKRIGEAEVIELINLR